MIWNSINGSSSMVVCVVFVPESIVCLLCIDWLNFPNKSNSCTEIASFYTFIWRRNAITIRLNLYGYAVFTIALTIFHYVWSLFTIIVKRLPFQYKSLWNRFRYNENKIDVMGRLKRSQADYKRKLAFA